MERFRERGLIWLFTVKYSNLFKKDYKLMRRRGLDLKQVKDVIYMLANNEKLPEKYKDHYLLGKYKRVQRMPYTARLAFNL